MNFTGDMKIPNQYFKKCMLLPKPSKTKVAYFHLNNRQARHEVKIVFERKEIVNN